MSDSEKIALTREHFLATGCFGPFNYAIGLELSIDELLNIDTTRYPLAEDCTEYDVKEFLRTLSFHHEIAHLCQFVSSGLGLRSLRYTLVLYNALSKGPPRKLPLSLSIPLDLERFPDDLAWPALLVFADIMHQSRIDQAEEVSDEFDVPDIEWNISWIPWSPHYFMGADGEQVSPLIILRFLLRNNYPVRRIPVLTTTAPQFRHKIAINNASLMEAFALLVELNHIRRALSWTIEQIFEALPRGNEYTAILTYFVGSELCPLRTVIPTMAVAIDAALMHDMFVLYDVPWDMADGEGRRDCYVGETFVRICEAIPLCTPIGESSDDEMARFYEELCSRAGLPTPEWMASRSLEVATRLADQVGGRRAILGNALTAHVEALKFRHEEGPSRFPFVLLTDAGQYEVVQRVGRALSLYDLNRRQPDNFDLENNDSLTAHSLLMQAIFESSVQCPLKAGDPFFCPAASSPPDYICASGSGEASHRCFLETFEQILRL